MVNVTIVTVCYNSSRTIIDTFDSVLCQTLIPFEYIIIDGGSNDGTINIIKDYESEFLDKGIIFKWYSEKDAGIYDAMNKGLSLATGDWLHFLNSDDYYMNKYVLENVYRYLLQSTAMVLYGQTISVGENKQSLISPIPAHQLGLNMLIGCPIQQPSTFFRRSLFVDKKYKFDISFRVSADYKMFVQMINDGIHFQFIPIFVTCFNEGGVSTLCRDDLTFKEDIQVLKDCKVSTLLMRMKANSVVRKILIVLFQILSKF